MTAMHTHNALQFAAVGMIYALGVITIIRGLHVMSGTVVTPSAALLLALGSYLIAKGLKHTWLTTEMMESSKAGCGFTRHLEVPITLDVILISVGAAVLVLSARQSLGRWAAPAVVVALLGVMEIGIAVTRG